MTVLSSASTAPPADSAASAAACSVPHAARGGGFVQGNGRPGHVVHGIMAVLCCMMDTIEDSVRAPRARSSPHRREVYVGVRCVA
jgi:hypothetical protein